MSSSRITRCVLRSTDTRTNLCRLTRRILGSLIPTSPANLLCRSGISFGSRILRIPAQARSMGSWMASSTNGSTVTRLISRCGWTHRSIVGSRCSFRVTVSRRNLGGDHRIGKNANSCSAVTKIKNAISEVPQYERSSIRSRRRTSALTALEGLVKRLVAIVCMAHVEIWYASTRRFTKPSSAVSAEVRRRQTPG
jgi:hypothetical protein